VVAHGDRNSTRTSPGLRHPSGTYVQKEAPSEESMTQAKDALFGKLVYVRDEQGVAANP
jgi:hypothetical protein